MHRFQKVFSALVSSVMSTTQVTAETLMAFVVFSVELIQRSRCQLLRFAQSAAFGICIPMGLGCGSIAFVCPFTTLYLTLATVKVVLQTRDPGLPLLLITVVRSPCCDLFVVNGFQTIVTPTGGRQSLLGVMLASLILLVCLGLLVWLAMTWTAVMWSAHGASSDLAVTRVSLNKLLKDTNDKSDTSKERVSGKKTYLVSIGADLP